MSMATLLRTVVGLALSAWLASGAPWVVAQTPVHKCVINGTVTFQRDPCPSGVPARPPTKEELNADRKKRTSGTAAPATSAPAPAAAPAVPESGFRCDGRKYCSQMRSCSEARFFLANCPGVKMDGDRNGVPCEQQWCGR